MIDSSSVCQLHLRSDQSLSIVGLVGRSPIGEDHSRLRPFEFLLKIISHRISIVDLSKIAIYNRRIANLTNLPCQTCLFGILRV